MSIIPGVRFSKTVSLTHPSIADFARAAGDLNPLHHDAVYARQTRFGRIIASGPHTSALLMGATATHFGRVGAMVGMEFSFRFRAPVYAEDLTLEWLIIMCTHNTRLRGHIVDLRGRAVRLDGVTAVGAQGRVLVHDM